MRTYVFNSLEYISRSEIAESDGNSTVNFKKLSNFSKAAALFYIHTGMCEGNLLNFENTEGLILLCLIKY